MPCVSAVFLGLTWSGVYLAVGGGGGGGGDQEGVKVWVVGGGGEGRREREYACRVLVG